MSERDGAPVALTAAEMTDPVALLERLGTDKPVHKVLLPDGMPGWLVTGYKEARRALSDPRLARSNEHADASLQKYLALYNDEFFRHSMVFNDRPRHTRMKKLVSQAFTPRYLENLRPKVQRITDDLIDSVVSAGEAEVIESLAVPLPNSVICDWFGVPMSDREEFRYHCGVVTGLSVSTNETELAEAGKYFDRYLGELIDHRKVDSGGDDMVSAILHGQEDNATLSDIELRANIFLMLTGSVETAVNMIANGLLQLIRNPGQTARLRADPSLIPQAVEEILRIDPPVVTVAYHFAKDTVAIGDVMVEPGEHVVISMPATNYDAREFPEPARFDIDRAKPHLSFSHGIHFCLGAPLARLEGDVFFTTLLNRLQDIELAVPEADLAWKPSYFVHRLEALPIRFTASMARAAA
ncbi:cytochrome P450 [Streptomyces sp. NBC_01754]|uniref:cytochrome P450 family protein n=1 Tax=Streptomyces sp. NBC_01754 TaxID=2975930 RepID=UPI002DD7E970|nr:cytochrome P450 [Streptomyces sp. NBC_01754]WSC90918.1 cytochrome P450 [Streptomyces sp. NBC_01754]WSC96588.1 cytochrome P450 [Streptomyces sp. NBC_01754]